MEKITFATTCMGRKQHLMTTLTANLRTNQYPNVEFLILDYNSPDGLAEWLREALRAHLNHDVNLYCEKTRQFFVMSHAKNVACLLAAGDIVVNVDADQCIDAEFGFRVAEAMSKPHSVAWPTVKIRSKAIWDIGGIIAIRPEDFRILGGYDEDMCHGWGVEDFNLKQRAKAMGFRIANMPLAWRFIRHEDAIRNENTKDKLSKAISARRHKRIHFQAMRERRYVANLLRVAGKAKVIRNFSTEVEVGFTPLPLSPNEFRHRLQNAPIK